MILITRSTENITLKIDPSVVLATRNYVDTKAIALETGINDQLRDKQPLDETLSDLSGKAPQDILKYLGLLGDGELSSIGRFVGVKVFTSSGKYVPDKSVRFVVVEGVGGGAGGGGSCSPLEGKMSAAAGGMGGSYGKMITKVDGDVMVYIGYGGTGGQGSKNQEGAKKGTAGGDTQFGTWLICPGGSEGKASNSFTPPSICQSSNRTGKECTGANIYQINGDAAGQGLAINGGGLSGRGADSVFGRGGNSVSSMTSSPGEKGYGFGSGGSGALSNSNSPGEKGGDGSPGLIIIWEYA